MKYVAGYSLKQVHETIRKAQGDHISVAVRDRPFERTVTMLKDSNGYCGFDFKDGKINTLVKDSSAARNGLLINHQLLEVCVQSGFEATSFWRPQKYIRHTIYGARILYINLKKLKT